jgi:ATP-dependent RNA helicase MSS116
METDAADTEVAAPTTTQLAHMTQHKFANLQISSESRKAIAEVFKYEYMTAVQAETLPLLLKDNTDCLAKAKTGTGKTLAFMIPTIEKILALSNGKKQNSNDIHCLVISPTRELAQQIGTETEKLLTFHQAHLRKVVVCVGGTNKNKDVRVLQGTTPIVVATPGRLLDHLKDGLAKRMTNLSCLIFDEADQLLDMGFRPDIERILALLNPSAQTRQTLLFSATIPPSVSEIAGIALHPKYHFVDTVGEDSVQTHERVQQQVMISNQGHQLRSIMSILERETSNKLYKIIVFFTTARLTGFLAELFNSVSFQTGYKVLEIHSRKTQKAREQASEEFRKSRSAVMFTSDVTARGMDYPDVTFVLQVGLTDRAQYIHRLGRTARAGKDGKGGLLLSNYEEEHMVKNELKDMPLEPTPITVSAKTSAIVEQAKQNVGNDKTLRVSAEQAYRAWLGYYNGHLKKVRWDKKLLVRQANLWAQQIGLLEQPSLQRKTIGKMGLKGTPGLKIE